MNNINLFSTYSILLLNSKQIKEIIKEIYTKNKKQELTFYIITLVSLIIILAHKHCEICITVTSLCALHERQCHDFLMNSRINSSKFTNNPQNYTTKSGERLHPSPCT